MIPTYYIAIINEKGEFQLLKSGVESCGRQTPQEYISETEALKQLELEMTMRGRYNVMLLKKVYVDVDINIKIAKDE
jgi:hypothetical protein